MPHPIALAVEALTTLAVVAGMGYLIAACVAAIAFIRARRRPLADYAPNVSILKSLKGLDPSMLDAFRSHCRQQYAGDYELLFGVSTLDDPAVAAVRQLQAEFPARSIQLIECPLQLGTNGKISTLAQMMPHANYDFLLVNDSDIAVTPQYLNRVMACFAPRPGQAKPVGLVTALYRGRAHGTLPSHLEALGLSTDFQGSVMLATLVEGGLHFAMGSTLAMRREALDKIGGVGVVVNHLADDYEIGVRIDRAGYRIELCSEVVETGVPAYTWRAYFDHQLRWGRTVRDARPGGYFGLIFTHVLCWAVLNLLASGASPLSLWLVGLAFFLRLAMAMIVGTQALGDHEVLPYLWLVPLRDVLHMAVWLACFAGNTIVWRGQRFVLKDGMLTREQA